MAHQVPEGLAYSKEHEWVRRTGEDIVIGITDHAQDALTDVVYVDLPDPGKEFAANEVIGVVESVKSVSDIYAPIALTVIASNGDLDGSPELINDDPYGKGWMIKARPADGADLDSLLDAAGYRALTESGGGS